VRTAPYYHHSLRRYWRRRNAAIRDMGKCYKQELREFVRAAATELAMPFNLLSGESSYSYSSGRIDHAIYCKQIGATTP